MVEWAIFFVGLALCGGSLAAFFIAGAALLHAAIPFVLGLLLIGVFVERCPDSITAEGGQ